MKLGIIDRRDTRKARSTGFPLTTVGIAEPHPECAEKSRPAVRARRSADAQHDFADALVQQSMRDDTDAVAVCAHGLQGNIGHLRKTVRFGGFDDADHSVIRNSVSSRPCPPHRVGRIEKSRNSVPVGEQCIQGALAAVGEGALDDDRVRTERTSHTFGHRCGDLGIEASRTVAVLNDS